MGMRRCACFGVRAAQRLAEPGFTPDLVSLVLVDPKSRVPASMAFAGL
ncbi:MAG: hypothetical protein ACOX20_10110 [Limnochordia bacterium]